jgi:hypothetical protein
MDKKKATNEASDIIMSPRVEDMKYLLACVFDCHRILSLSSLDQQVILEHLKHFDAYSMIPFPIIPFILHHSFKPFLFDLFKSYLLSPNF